MSILPGPNDAGGYKHGSFCIPITTEAHSQEENVEASEETLHQGYTFMYMTLKDMHQTSEEDSEFVLHSIYCMC